MDSNYLDEYEQREVEALQRNIPISKRIDRLKTPIFNLVEDSHAFWSQIPFSGTIIFPLHPIPSDFFETVWNISVNDFPDLIKFVRDTKKIQFVLTQRPRSYKEFDYLEPILKEFSPPMYSSNLNIYDKKLEDLLSSSREEYLPLIQKSPEWQKQSLSVTGQHTLATHLKSYALLRYYGFNEIADIFILNFVPRPVFAHTYMAIVEHVILHPIADPIHANLSLSIETIQKAQKMGILSHTTLKRPCVPEIGSFLMKKCTHYPESLEACKSLIERYEDNDLYKVHSALNEAVIDRNDPYILQKRDEMNSILDNVWEDKTIKQNAMMYRGGIDITCGIVGHILDQGTGLFGMIIPELINVASSQSLETFSELIAKKVANPYMATIYDFKKKCPI